MDRWYHKTLIGVGIAVLYGVILRVFFGVDSMIEFFNVMSLSFLILLPGIMGFLIVYFSPAYRAQNIFFCISAPWIPVLLFFLITILISLEGWACWIMVLPLFLPIASAGGVLGYFVRKRKAKNNLRLSLVMLLPLMISPVEQWIGSNPKEFEVYTFIDIAAPAEVIWDEVTRVSEIEEADDTGNLTRFIGLPRPVKAELNYEGVGAYREAVFTNGLVFHEKVISYRDNEYMKFSIRADPHEIPSTTLDEHILIGGAYFDVLDGTYKLEPLGNGIHRLHLSSSFQMNTTFNRYAGWWGTWIMEDIQMNILRMEKSRAETKTHSSTPKLNN